MTLLVRAPALVLVYAAVYSRMVTGGARTQTDWIFIREAAR